MSIFRRLWWAFTGRWTWRKPRFDDGLSGKAVQMLQEPTYTRHRMLVRAAEDACKMADAGQPQTLDAMRDVIAHHERHKPYQKAEPWTPTKGQGETDDFLKMIQPGGPFGWPHNQ